MRRWVISASSVSWVGMVRGGSRSTDMAVSESGSEVELGRGEVWVLDELAWLGLVREVGLSLGCCEMVGDGGVEVGDMMSEASRLRGVVEMDARWWRREGLVSSWCVVS